MPFHQVYTCGHGAGGRLGLNDEKPRSSFQGPLGTLEGVVVSSIVCGSKHNMLLSRQGVVYAWGYNQNGQTGHGPHGFSDWEPRPIKGLDKIKVVEVAAGEDHSMALTHSADVYSWGHGLYGQLGQGDVKDIWFPFMVKSLQGKGIMSVGCGHNHSFAVTVTGKVFGFGSSSAGQLGNGDTDGGMGGNVYLPLLIKNLANYKIVLAQGGKNFSMFMTSNGELFSVGYAANGQLGISFDKVEALGQSYTASLQKVEHQGITMAAVSCGDAHIAAVSDAGMIYTWGAGSDWVLGHGDQEDAWTPKLVTMLEAEVCLHASAGGCHTTAVTQAGRLYTWGRGFIGQLGRGHDVAQDVHEFYEALPASVQWASDAEGAELAIMGGAGFCHTVLLTALAGDEEEDIKPPTPRPEPPKDMAGASVKPPPKKRAAQDGAAVKAKPEAPKRQLLTLHVTVVSARDMIAKDARGTSDPYVKVKVKEGRHPQKERTKVLSQTRDPTWNEKFVFKEIVNRIAIEGDPRLFEEGKLPDLNWDVRLKLSCYDKDKIGKDEHLGLVFIPLAGLGINKVRDIWVPLSPKIEGQVVKGDIRVKLELTDKDNKDHPGK
mmetsp:Transcript_13488/g.33009  ORF Transcript_13488/g.33009 Transcript_13488/m.33009 type:complete len:600 (+) Transcript_13488:3-1802(+)